MTAPASSNWDEGNFLTVTCGKQHVIRIPQDLAEQFDRLLTRLRRPAQRILRGVLGRIEDTPLAELALNSEYWKIEVKGAVPIFAIRKDQARLYCCVRGQDIVILAWDQKKQRKANPEILARAERRAKEYGLDSE